MRALVIVVLLAGCARGRALPDWTLEVDGETREVKLPNALATTLRMRELTYTLRTSVDVASAQRGQPMTLAFPCFHGALAASANGVALVDIGDTDVGEHRFVIDGAITRVGRLALAVRAQLDELSAQGVGAVPRLLDGARRARLPQAAFNRYLGTTETVFSILFLLLFGTLYVLDRRNRADGLFALQSLAALPCALWPLGLSPPWLYIGSTCLATVFLFAYVNVEFGIDRPPRFWLVLWTIFALVSPVATISLPVLWVYGGFVIVFGYAGDVYIIRLLLRIARTSKRRADARLLAAATTLAIAGFLSWQFAAFTNLWLFDGVHHETIGIVAFGVAQVVIKARHLVASRRELERANTELQRQVAVRSKELASALAALAKQPKPLDVAQTIDGRYRVVRKLGAGGMGTVHEVERDGQCFALKTLRGRAEPELLARFAREAQVAAEISHPNLVPVVDVGIADGAMFFVMPLVDGGSLDGQRGRFGDAAWARPILAQIATGLAALHRKGIVHRDLKPANVLIDRGVARISDFGLAAIQPPDLVVDASTQTIGKAAELTRAGEVVGTPKYMAPELAAGVKHVAPSSDVFAFGLIACELLANRAAFIEPPILTRLAGRSIPTPAIDGLPDVVARCLDLDPAKRPGATELAAAFT